MEGKLIIICAPSGSGKSTIIGRIINDERLRLAFSVSATTRPRRGEEVHGVDYYYLTEEEFNDCIEYWKQTDEKDIPIAVPENEDEGVAFLKTLKAP